MTSRRRGPSSCFQPLFILAGARSCPWTQRSRWAGRPPDPRPWRRRQPPSCWLSSPGWCHPRGTKVSAGVCRRSGAPGGLQPAGSRSRRGAGGGEGGEGEMPCYSNAEESIGACGVWGAWGGALWGTGKSGGGAGRHPERSRKPASPSRPCLRECSFPADSLLPRGPSAGRCLPGWNAQIQPPLPQPGSQVKDQKRLPCSGASLLPSPSPCHAASTAGWGCSCPLQPGLRAGPR